MGDDLALAPRLCTVRKWADFAGYGFNLHAERGRAGQFIGKVDDASPAQAAGMKEGDRIVEVNGVNIGNENHSQVVTRIKASGDHVTMLLVDIDTDRHFKEQKVVIANDIPEVVRIETPPRPSEDGPQELDDVEETPEPEPEPEAEPEPEPEPEPEADPESDPEDIQNVEQPEPDEIVKTVESDTEDTEDLVQEVQEIDAEENVEVSARDDDIPPPPPDSEPPAYEEEPPREPTPEPEPELEPVAVSIEPPPHDYHPRQCCIKKWPDFQGYGFNLHAEKEKTGQYIGAVDLNSPADEAHLKQGDRIIEVNGVNIEDESHTQVIQRIKAGGDQTTLLVVDPEADEFYKNHGLRIHSSLDEVLKYETSEREAKEMTFHPRECHLVKWPDFNGYGFNLHAEKERGAQFIGKIDAGSPAEEAGLRENDRIIAVNGANVEEETHQQVIGRIKAGGDETRLLVVDKEADAYYKNKGITVTTALPEVNYQAAARRSPRPGAPAVANGDTTNAQPTQPTRIEPVKEPSAQANGGDFLNMSAKEMRERLAQKKKADPKHKLDFKSKHDIFQKM